MLPVSTSVKLLEISKLNALVAVVIWSFTGVVRTGTSFTGLAFSVITSVSGKFTPSLMTTLAVKSVS